MLPDLSTRIHTPEMMDDPSIDAADLEATLYDLARVNAALHGYAPSMAGIETLAGELTRPLSVLDVGCGAGDFAAQLARRFERLGGDLYVLGIDLSPVAVDTARKRCIAFHNLEFEQTDLFDIPARRSFDIVHAALMLHHLDDSAAIEGLRKMYELSRLGVVINDLHRHWLAYLGSRIVLPLLSRNPMIHHDGSLSVRRGFRRSELVDLVHRAGLPTPTIRWHPLFRWQMHIPRRAQ